MSSPVKKSRGATKKPDKPPAPKRRKANGYKFPEKFPEGEILKDVGRKEWALGPSIGKGGFGEVYSAKLASASGKTFPYVVKIEPHGNGPLFTERTFYLNVLKHEVVEDWKKSQGIKSLGIPIMQGFGSHEYKGEKYRFIVLDKYGQDLWSLFLDKKRVFPFTSICQYAMQIIDCLNFIHFRGYVHADIKGANLLQKSEQVYLVDFGIACKYTTSEFKRDPKRAHNGTIEYTSQDWHMGVPTRRGDMEILGFNLLQWANSKLPWESDLKSAEKVHEKKSEFMKSVKANMKKHFPDAPEVIGEYLYYVSKLEYDEEPDYKLCKGMFAKALKKGAGTPKAKALKKEPETPNGLRTSLRRKSSASPEKRFRSSITGIVPETEDEESPIVEVKPRKRRPLKKETPQEGVNSPGEHSAKSAPKRVRKAK